MLLANPKSINNKNMSDTPTFKDIARSAQAGCWRLEVKHNGPQVTWPAGPVLTARIMELAGRAPFEATKSRVGNGKRLYLAATLGDGAVTTCDFVGTNKPDSKPTVDIRTYSRAFRDDNGDPRRIVSIMYADDFSIGVDNVFRGGRKVQGTEDNPANLPSWEELDWGNLERVCPITAEGTAEFLGMLSTDLDKAPLREFEEMATELRLTV